METKDYGSYSSTYAFGTMVKTWISEGGRLCIEKFSHYDDLGQYDLLFCTLFAEKGYRGEVSKLTTTALTFTYESPVTLKPDEKVCVIADGWCFLHFYYGGFGGYFFNQAIKAAVAGLPADISADIYLVGGGQQSDHKGCWVSEARIENGTFSVPEPSSTSGNTGANPFVFAFLVRDGGFKTAAQSAVKAVFKQLSQSWKNLTNEQILSGNSLANTQKGKSVLGTSSKISGANLYSRLNFWIVKAGGTALSAPPVLVGVDAPCEADLSLTADQNFPTLRRSPPTSSSSLWPPLRRATA